MTFHCLTFGCRVNQYETQAIREQLQVAGCREVAELAEADWVVINSCTVTAQADRECLRTLRALSRRCPGVRILVAGCLAQKDSALLQQMPGVRLLVGTGQKHRVADLLLQEEKNPWRTSPRLELEMSKVYSPLSIGSFSHRQKAFVKIQDGCNRACAFCKVPYVRGRARSRPLEEVLAEVSRLVHAGYKEIILAGVAVGLWGLESNGKGELGRLVRAVDRLPGVFRIRLSSLDPRDLNPILLEVLSSSAKVCRHLHLSLQSGSNRVLRRMNRGYTREDFSELVRRVRQFWPDLGLTTDWIVGFPGETEEAFRETLEFCRRLEFAKVHVFSYSRRRGTSAWSLWGGVGPEPVRRL